MSQRKNLDSKTISQPTIASITQRLRSLRKSRGWSLSEVERRSGGAISAISLGSYERGDRAMSLNRCIELAAFFDVPIAYLLGGETPHLKNSVERPMIDLRRVRSENFTSLPQADKLRTFLTWISAQRQDWNGEILSLRKSDISLLALLLAKEEAGVILWLKESHSLIEAQALL